MPTKAANKCQCRQGRRRDGKTFSGRGGRVADRVEIVGTFTNFRRQLAHLGDAARVIGDRSERVDRKLHRGRRHHSGGGDRYAVKSGKVIRSHDTAGQGQDRDNGRFHTDRQAADDVGRVSGRRLLNDRVARAFCPSPCSIR